MAEDKPSLHIDSDWKKQAQEEKKRLAEQEEQARKASAGAAAGPAGVVTTSAATAAAGGPEAPAQPSGKGQRREMPLPSLETLAQSLLTQALYYLGELNTRAGQPAVDLDMAKHHVDTLAVLEEKTRNNLTPDEQHVLDAALYEARMRYISVASHYAQLP